MYYTTKLPDRKGKGGKPEKHTDGNELDRSDSYYGIHNFVITKLFIFFYKQIIFLHYNSFLVLKYILYYSRSFVASYLPPAETVDKLPQQNIAVDLKVSAENKSSSEAG